MSIIKRFRDIMAANVNAVLDKMENPDKMIDQYIRNIENDFAKVKAETAEMMAQEAQANRALVNLEKHIASYEESALKALETGAEDDAAILVSRKLALEASRESHVLNVQVAKENAEKMRQLHDKLENDLNMVMAKKNELKAKIALAETQEKINKVNAKENLSGMSELDKLGEKIDFQLDKANSMAALNSNSENAEKLRDKYNSGLARQNEAVSAELERLRGQLNK